MRPAATPRALAPGWRAVRVGALGTTSLALAAGAHLAGGGALPGVGFLAIVALLLGLVAVPLTARRIRLPLLIGVLAAEQVGLHLALGASAPIGCLPGGTHHAPALTCSGVMVESGHEAMVAGSGAMWVAHALAVLATAWLLARGERWLWRVVDRIVAAATPTRTSFRTRVAPILVPGVICIRGRRPSAPLPARGPPVPV